MLSRFTTGVALLLAATNAVAQTSTSCNPTEKTCPDDTGLSSSTYTHDFTTSGADDDNWKVTAGNVAYTSSGAEFTINKSGDHPTIQSKWYLFFGRVSFVIKAAPGTGIVSSAILESDDLDEVDWEWVGGRVNQVQSNYFGKGNTTSYDRAAWADVSNTQSTTHNYTVSWTSSATTWYIDNVAVRTLNYGDAVGGKNYPQTPMNIRIGIWAGGDPSNDPGTIEWAGGETDYSAGPFTMTLEKIEVVNDNPGSSYAYGDLTGSYESIKIDGAAGTKSVSQSAPSSSVSVAPSSSSASVSLGKSGAETALIESSSGTLSKVLATATASASAGASASASTERAETATSLATTLSLNVWSYGVIGLLTLVAACR